jgi:hypothetical protein
MNGITPRCDALAREHDRPMLRNTEAGKLEDWIALAQQLERELRAATPNPGCEYCHGSGRIRQATAESVTSKPCRCVNAQVNDER